MTPLLREGLQVRYDLKRDEVLDEKEDFEDFLAADGGVGLRVGFGKR